MVIITTALTYVGWHEQSCVSSTSMYRNFYCTWKKCFSLVPSHQLELGYGYQKPHVMHTHEEVILSQQREQEKPGWYRRLSVYLR